MRRIVSLLSVLLLLASAPLALAHDGHSGTAAPLVSPNTHCWSDQNPHDYEGAGAGVGDYNLWDEADCASGAHDKLAVFFDGDYEFGTGSGFFPAGVWADDPDCDYGLTPHHHTSVHVHPEVLVPHTEALHWVHFTVGADPTPPTLVENPDAPGTYTCVTDGSITPGIDGDDWLHECVHACALPSGDSVNPWRGLPGGNGGYWVWVMEGVSVDMGDASAGHIWFP